MDFGRVDLIDQLTFALPPDAADTARVLQKAGATSYLKPQLYVGCPTWNNQPWLGSYYPAGAPAHTRLHWYSQQFNTLELNTTHYQIPEAATINRWRRSVGPDFTFCPKLPQLISHTQQLRHSSPLTEAFCNRLQGLQTHLGCGFLQLPPNFGPQQLDTLLSYLTEFPRDFPLAVELRDPAWFNQEIPFGALSAALEAYNLGLVITDVAGRRDVLHMRLTNTTAFIRFVGYGLHPTDYARLNQWVRRLQTWFEQGLQKLYFFIHQQNISHAPVLVQYFLAQVEQVCNISLPPPKVIPQLTQGKLF